MKTTEGLFSLFVKEKRFTIFDNFKLCQNIDVFITYNKIFTDIVSRKKITGFVYNFSF